MIGKLRKVVVRRALLGWVLFVLALGFATACSDTFAPRFITPNDSTPDPGMNDEQG